MVLTIATGTAKQQINSKLIHQLDDLREHLNNFMSSPLPDHEFRKQFSELIPEIRVICGDYWLARTRSLLTFQEAENFPEELHIRGWITQAYQDGWGWNDETFRKLAVIACEITKSQVLTAREVFECVMDRF